MFPLDHSVRSHLRLSLYLGLSCLQCQCCFPFAVADSKVPVAVAQSSGLAMPEEAMVVPAVAAPNLFPSL